MAIRPETETEFAILFQREPEEWPLSRAAPRNLPFRFPTPLPKSEDSRVSYWAEIDFRRYWGRVRTVRFWLRNQDSLRSANAPIFVVPDRRRLSRKLPVLAYSNPGVAGLNCRACLSVQRP